MPEATLHASPFRPCRPFRSLILEHSIFVPSNKEIDYILMFQVFLIGVFYIFGEFRSENQPFSGIFAVQARLLQLGLTYQKILAKTSKQ